ncbi:hypothetical protein X729_30900 [Mesorhizobium sp. L103C131B0]|nr:hypothetical protein X729_30900 [Mesorhizobium sp. L103C131B0]
MASIIDGKRIAAAIIDSVKAGAISLQAKSGIQPSLAVIVVGDDPASHVYVNATGKMADYCGFRSVQHTLPGETTQDEL